jgi:LPXTG-motif cell wall-anchored protein
MSSRAFRTTRLTPYRGDSARGVATIDRDARPGRYDITVNCDGRTLTRPSAFTVLGGVQGGVGGSQSHGATATDMAIGGGLVGAAVIGGGVFWLRRRNEKRI